MDVRKLSLAFGVTHVVYGMCYLYEQTPAGYWFTATVIASRKRLCGPERRYERWGRFALMRHVSVPSPFHLRSVRMVCVHTVRRVQSPSRTARERRPAIISINMQSHSFSKRQLAATALMLDEEEKNAALSDKKTRMWVQKCFRSRKSEGSYGINSDGGIFAHSKLGKYLETHLGIPEGKQLPATLSYYG